MTHAIMGTSGELVGVLLVSRNLAHLSRMQSTLAYSRKLVALGQLTAGIAHEVKNPLNAMMIHLELLRTKIRGTVVAMQPEAVAAAGGMLGLGPGRAAALPAPVQGALEHVSIIESEIRRLDEVVQGFLKFTRPEDLRLQPVKVNALMDEILPIIETEANKHNVKVTIDVPSTVPAVNGDSAMLRQAFLNLAINACQAMPSGGSLASDELTGVAQPRRGSCAGHGGRYRPGAPVENFQPLLHHQGTRDRHRPLHGVPHHSDARRRSRGTVNSGPRDDVPRPVATRKRDLIMRTSFRHRSLIKHRRWALSIVLCALSSALATGCAKASAQTVP